jgi:hypothetical protein
MSEQLPRPLFSNENPYPNRIEDIEKAHVMALAGDELRSWAVVHRSAAQRLEHRDPTTARGLTMSAELTDKEAGEFEEYRGEIYDEFPSAPA